jgi:hypothetical protein
VKKIGRQEKRKEESKEGKKERRKKGKEGNEEGKHSESESSQKFQHGKSGFSQKYISTRADDVVNRKRETHPISNSPRLRFIRLQQSSNDRRDVQITFPENRGGGRGLEYNRCGA